MNKNVYLIGPSGSGKSVIAQRLAEAMDCDAIDTDTIIRERTGNSISVIFEVEGEVAFRRLERHILDEIADAPIPAVIATGGGLPTIEGAMETMLGTGITVYLEADVDELWARVLGDLDERPLLQGEGGFERLEQMVRLRSPVYRRAAVTVRTSELTVDQVVRLVRSQVEEPEPESN